MGGFALHRLLCAEPVSDAATGREEGLEQRLPAAAEMEIVAARTQTGSVNSPARRNASSLLPATIEDNSLQARAWQVVRAIACPAAVRSRRSVLRTPSLTVRLPYHLSSTILSPKFLGWWKGRVMP